MASPFDIAVDYYQQNLGLTPEQARGAVRWMDRIESGLNPSAVNPTSGAYGIGQWLGPRKSSLFSRYGNAPTFGQQLEHSVSELLGPESRALEALRGAKTEDEAFRLWGKHYERPSAAEYAKATGGYSSGLRRPSGPREGYYGGALHVTLRPEGVEDPFPMDAALDGLLGDAEPEPESSPSLMLDDLLEMPPPEEAKKQPAATEYIEPPGPLPEAPVVPRIPPAPEQGEFKRIRGISGEAPEAMPEPIRPAPVEAPTIEPPGMGQPAPPMPQAIRQQIDVGTGIPLETGPQRGAMPADTFLDHLLSGATDVGTSLAALAERFNMGVANVMRPPGSEPRRSSLEVKPALEGVLTFATGGLLNPLSIAPRAGQIGRAIPPRRGGGGDISYEIIPMPPEAPAGAPVAPGARVAYGEARQAPVANDLGNVAALRPQRTTRPDRSLERPLPGASEDELAEWLGGVIEKYGENSDEFNNAAVFVERRLGIRLSGLDTLANDTSGALRLPPEVEARAKSLATSIENGIRTAVRDTQIKAVPMAAGTDPGQAIAKDYANAERLARYRRTKMDTQLRKLSPEDQRAMWEAMDNASVEAQQTGDIKGAGARFLGPLPRHQQDLLMEMERTGIDLWEQARDAGMIAEGAERLPFYVMRGVLEISDDGVSKLASRAGRGQGLTGLDQFGVNLATGKPMSRGYLTAAETEAAARAKTGSETAEIVRNIRVLPLAYERFEKQIAWRRLINDIKAIGEATGKPTVAEGERLGDGWFTVDHPAFKTYRPRMTQNPETGKVEPLRDPAGNIVFDRVPLYVSREFEGPLRAITRGETGSLYNAAMQAKAAAMSMVMNSPLIHNQVEWGRALGAMPGKVATFKIYGTGARTIADTKAMEQAIRDGLVPIGERGYLQDIEGIATGADLKPGRGLFAKGAGALTDIVSPQAGEAVRRGIDKAGDFWHQKLLWDQVAKLQAGLYTEFKAHLAKKGVGEDAAGKIAAHLANRYAGAIPNESMSEGARKLLNMTLFSRSFTMGNLGVMKDMINGLPRDVRAQVGRDLTAVEQQAVKSLARRKAIATVLSDVGIMFAANALLQDGIEALRNDPEGALGRAGVGAGAGGIAGRLAGGPGGAAIGAIIGGLGGAMIGDIHRIADDYMERLGELMKQAQENPASLINPLDDIAALSPVHENEPGKEERIRIGHRDDGQAVYGRAPVGKIGEEFVGWVTKPLGMLKNKWGTFVRPLLNIYNNDRGFAGQVERVYNPYPHGLGDYASNLGSIVMEIARSQTNVTQIEAGLRALGLSGEAPADWVDTLQATAPFAGFTVSKGAPGGEMVGELYQAKGEHQAKLQAAMPKIRDLVKGGKEEQAAAMLDELGVHPRLRQYYLRVFADPSRRLSGKALHEFERYATPEQKKRMEMQQRRQTREPVAR